MEFILEYLNIVKSCVDWRTLFDVPIIAALFLILYRTLKTSGSWHIGIGIIILILIYSLANLFRLSGISWIFDNLSNIALIAIIVIFQPEIRKIFERTTSTFRIKRLLKESKYLSLLISEAVIKLAHSQWGAIIILPGKESLESKISGGIPICAKPSVPLIVSIFDHHSPGHDGAMIIENGEITKFGCRLPLSTSEKLGNEYGTRHHASMGLSEVSDSLVIAVSEERRTVTVFTEGSHKTIKSREELQQIIEEHWKEGSRFLPLNIFLKNKISLVLEIGFSLVLAFILWLSIMVSVHQVKEVSAEIPIEYKLSGKMVMIGENPVTAKIKISGPVLVMNRLNPEELKAAIDLTRSKAGEFEISIGRNDINIPREVNLLDVDPSNFRITIHSFNQQELEVRPQLIGNLPEDFEIEKIEVSPDKLPALFTTELNAAEEVSLTTTPIYLQTITQSSKLMCEVIAPRGVIPVNNRQWPQVIISLTLKKIVTEEPVKEKEKEKPKETKKAVKKKR